ncbi:hypothetical protein, partial [Prevotella sp.]|uniref:hypothetical protein n=1 Tax=Prevotella sp. TaxID=59823 RepID=UPI00307E22F4
TEHKTACSDCHHKKLLVHDLIFLSFIYYSVLFTVGTIGRSIAPVAEPLYFVHEVINKDA